MPARVETRIEPEPGFRSAAAGAWVAMMEAQRRALVSEIAELSTDDLAWQPAPGTNTIGMLLAHIAVAETHLTDVGLLGKPDSDVPAIIGIRVEDDGLPLPEGGRPPAVLAGKDAAYFRDLLARARAHFRAAAAALEDADLDRVVVRKRPDGGERVFNVRWVIAHALEHEAGHRGQILQLKHLRRAIRR